MNTSINTNPIAVSANNIHVFQHPESHSHRPDLDMEAISKIELPNDSTFVRTTIDMGHIVGKDHLVKTNKDDTIIYMQRGNRPGKSRMVLKEADDTSKITITLCVCNEPEDSPASALNGKWVLVTLFEGEPGEREPFDMAFANGKDPEGRKKSEAFWSTHALVPTEQELQQILKENATMYELWYEIHSTQIITYKTIFFDNEEEAVAYANLVQRLGRNPALFCGMDYEYNFATKKFELLH